MNRILLALAVLMISGGKRRDAASLMYAWRLRKRSGIMRCSKSFIFGEVEMIFQTVETHFQERVAHAECVVVPKPADSPDTFRQDGLHERKSTKPYHGVALRLRELGHRQHLWLTIDSER